MIHLLKIEWLKVKNYKAFWILLGLFVLSVYGVNYITHEVQVSTTTQVQSQVPAQAGDMARAVIGSPFQFPDVWQTVSYLSSYLLFLPGLLIIMLVTNEFTFRTHRQNVIDGLSRTQYIYTKMAVVAVVAAASTILIFIVAFLFGLVEPNSTLSFSKVEYVGYFFIQAISYLGIALLFSVLFKRAILAVGLYFMYIFILENMLAALINRYVVKGVGYFLPLESTDCLIPFPFFRTVTSSLNRPLPAAGYLLIAAVIYGAVYFYVCKTKFERENL